MNNTEKKDPSKQTYPTVQDLINRLERVVDRSTPINFLYDEYFGSYRPLREEDFHEYEDEIRVECDYK